MGLWQSERLNDTRLFSRLWQSDKELGQLFLPLKTSIIPHNLEGMLIPTFTRSTTATVTDFEGIIHTAKINELRFHSARRVENLCKTNYTLSFGLGVGIPLGGLPDPDGGNNAYSADETLYGDYTVTPNTQYIFSQWVRLVIATILNYAVYDITNSSWLIPKTSYDVSSEWTRKEFTFTTPSNCTQVRIYPKIALSGGELGDTHHYNPMLEKKVGTQTIASEYVSSGILSAPYHGCNVDAVKYFNTDREGNALAGLNGALLETIGTNSITYSQDFTKPVWIKEYTTISGNTAVAPDGSLTADKIIATTDMTNSHRIKYSAPLTGAYTFSIFLKNGDYAMSTILVYNTVDATLASISVNLASGVVTSTSGSGFNQYTIEAYSYGWYRVSLMFTPPTSGQSNTIMVYCNVGTFSGDGLSGIYAWGAQFEQASKTSYIPTNGTSVQRTNDILSYDISSLVTQGQGSLYCEFIFNGFNSNNYQYVYQLSSDSLNNRIWVYLDKATGIIKAVINNDGVNQVISTLATAQIGVIYKLLISYQDNNCSMYLTGIKISSSTSALVPENIIKLSLGIRSDNLYSSNVSVKNVIYFNKPLTEAQAIRITS